MSLQVTVERIGKKLHRLLIYSAGRLIGEYERCQEADIRRKRQEVANAEALLELVYRKHGHFKVRWNGDERRKSIRVNGLEVGEVPKEMWEIPSWEQ